MMNLRLAMMGAALGVASTLLSTGPALAISDESVGEPPGLQGRQTHMTLLTTHESDCSEVTVPRAVLLANAQALVPIRYAVRATNAVEPLFAQFVMWDYVCENLSVDGQRYAPRTQITLGATSISTRDGVAEPAAYYLNYLETDNPVLAARYRQVGLPAAFSPDLEMDASGGSGAPFVVSVAVSGPNAHTVTAASPVEPTPVVTSGGPRFFSEGKSGEVLLQYANEVLGSAPAAITADYREHQLLAPMIALPRLLQITGATFPTGSSRGTWASTVERID